jgi:predicted RNA binding protein YcfA (HicA-like mRNA interferase family)
MPRKIRQLRAELAHAGFIKETGRGKGSHTYWTHPLLPFPVVLSGHEGDDADHYQERDVRNAIRDAREAEKRRQP